MKTKKIDVPYDLETLEERKIREIEHSRQRRTILQGYERQSDTNKAEEIGNIDNLIRDKNAYQYHFSNAKFYSVSQSSEEYLQNWLREKCRPDLKVLDFACGNGENGIYAAKCGADVEGIDISPEGVENANMNARTEGVSGNCIFKVMDGENMLFPDNYVDYAVEYGALHHVDLERAMAELSRVLKPTGEMICVEALRHNPLIHWYRQRTPHLRTQWEVEHILRVEDLAVAGKYFKQVHVRFFHLAVLAAVPLRKTRFFVPLRSLLEKVDQYLLKSEAIGKYGWIMIFTLSEPGNLSG